MRAWPTYLSSAPIVQRHKASGEVWRRIERVGEEPLPGPTTVRVQREDRQHVLWLAYWTDDSQWEAIPADLVANTVANNRT